MLNLFLILLISHLLGDFYFQSDSFCKDKESKGIRGYQLYLHAAIVFMLTVLVVFQRSFWVPALIIAIIHFTIDCIKGYCGNHIKIKEGREEKALNDSRYKIFSFVIDQLLHLAVIILVTFLWTRNNAWMEYAINDSAKLLQVLLCATAILVCGKPSNIFIKLILRYCEVKEVQDDSANNFHSGALIGSLERWLILIFVLLNQYEAIGFLVAAKSILRFNEAKEGEKSEYVLSGTLLSLSIAIVCGLIINYFLK